MRLASELAFLFLFFSAALQAQTYPQTYRGMDLDPQLKQMIESEFHFNLQELALDQVDAIVRFLHIKKSAQQVQAYSDSQGNLSFEIRPARKLTVINWQGADSKMIPELEKSLGITLPVIFYKEIFEEKLAALNSTYIQKGYQNFSLSYQLVSSSASEIEAHILVHPGELVHLSAIQVQCRSPRLERGLNKIVKNYVGRIYREEEVLEIKKKITDYLVENHHIRAEVLGPNLQTEPKNSDIQLQFQVEKEDAYEIEFSGNSSFSKSELLSALELGTFFSASPYVGVELAKRLRKFYQAQAFARVQVESQEFSQQNEYEKKIVLTIVENPRIRINQISFSGTLSLPQQAYVERLEKFGTELIRDRYYDRESLEKSLNDFIKATQNLGFLQARILTYRANYDEAKTGVQIVINLDEGPQTFVGKIQFMGNQRLTDSVLYEVTGLYENQVLLLPQLNEAITKLKSLYQESGFIEMTLLNEFTDLVSYSEDNTKANVTFRIMEGPQVTLASVVIEGNSFTQSEVILHEIALKPGDLITPKKLDDARINLQRSGFFSSVSVRTLEEKTQIAERTLLISVTERDPGVFTLGAGATNDRGITLHAYSGIAYNNLEGTGRGISFRIEGDYNVTLVKKLQSKIILGYLEPYLFQSNTKGRVNLTRSEYVSNYDIRKATIANQISFSLEKNFTREISGNWTLWSLASVRDFAIEDVSPSLSIEKSLQISAIGPFLDFDFRDNPFQPTRGFLAKFAYEYSDPNLGSSETIHYWKATASFTRYLNLNSARLDNPFVWANQVRFGIIENIGSHADSGVPYDKKGFVLGGRDSLRGFEAGSSESFPNPRDLGSETFLLHTQSHMTLIKSELRFPIYKQFGGALFYDGGLVQISHMGFDDYYRDSAGLGIRYNTPIGPLSLEYAYKLDKKPFESADRFHLSIGTF